MNGSDLKEDCNTLNSNDEELTAISEKLKITSLMKMAFCVDWKWIKMAAIAAKMAAIAAILPRCEYRKEFSSTQYTCTSSKFSRSFHSKIMIFQDIRVLTIATESVVIFLHSS
jgi:hypothetical protein